MASSKRSGGELEPPGGPKRHKTLKPRLADLILQISGVDPAAPQHEPPLTLSKLKPNIEASPAPWHFGLTTVLDALGLGDSPRHGLPMCASLGNATFNISNNAEWVTLLSDIWRQAHRGDDPPTLRLTFADKPADAP